MKITRKRMTLDSFGVHSVQISVQSATATAADHVALRCSCDCLTRTYPGLDPAEARTEADDHVRPLARALLGNLGPIDLATALHVGARCGAERAAITLLVEHRSWLGWQHSVRDYAEGHWDDRFQFAVRIDWAELLIGVRHRKLSGPAKDVAVLLCAASVAGDAPILLNDLLVSIAAPMRVHVHAALRELLDPTSTPSADPETIDIATAVFYKVDVDTAPLATSADVDVSELTRALAVGTQGTTTEGAAVRLLLLHGVWPRRPSWRRYVAYGDDASHRRSGLVARIMWPELVEHMAAGEVVGHPSDLAVLSLAATLAGAQAVSLGAVLPVLDWRAAGLVDRVMRDLLGLRW